MNPRASRLRSALFAVVVLLVVAVVLMVAFGIKTELGHPAAVPVISTPEPSPTPTPGPQVYQVHFSATGDNLIHDGIYKQARNRAQDGGYDFDYAYENVKDFYSQFDLNWINQETLLTDACEPSGYPCFATPTDIFDSLYDVGWRAFNVSTNHSYDKGALGISSSMEFWNSTPGDVAWSGFYDLSSYDNYTYQTVNGIKFGYLSYTYGTNGIPTPSDTQYGVIYTDQLDIIQQQVAAVRSNCDVLIVSCHWGTEGSHTIHPSQTQLAQLLADWGADLIIGTHPHMIQNCQWLTAQDGRQAFVAYSLGNFLNFQASADNLIGGVLDITIQKTVYPDGSQTIELLNPQIHGAISHYDGGYRDGRVYMFSDYTQELAQSHGIRSSYPSFSLEYIQQVLEANVSPEFLSQNQQ